MYERTANLSPIDWKPPSESARRFYLPHYAGISGRLSGESMVELCLFGCLSPSVHWSGIGQRVWWPDTCDACWAARATNPCSNRRFLTNWSRLFSDMTRLMGREDGRAPIGIRSLGNRHSTRPSFLERLHVPMLLLSDVGGCFRLVNSR